MPLTKVREFLDSNHVKYVVVGHSPAYTALETAKSAYLPDKEIAKTVIVKIDGKVAMAVLPASYQVDFGLLKEQLGASDVELANEAEFKDLFADCELGAMPPFGNLYGMPVYVAESLAEDEEIAFNAGSHSVLFQMEYEDFVRLVRPAVIRFSAKTAAA